MAGLLAIFGFVLFCLISVDADTDGDIMNRFLEASPIHPQIKSPDVWAPESNIRFKITTNERYASSFSPQKDCSETKKVEFGDYGIITSPNYPRNYPGRKSCEWVIQGPTGSRVQAVIVDALTQPQSILYSDYIMIAKSGNFSFVDRLSGDLSEKTPIIVTSDGNKLGIRFRSNSLFNFRGFKIQYLVIPDEYKQITKSFETPAFDGVCGQSHAEFPTPMDAANSPVGSPAVAENVAESNSADADSEIPIIKPPSKKFAPVYTVGGVDVLKYSHPWMAAILIDDKHFCGGTLIDDQHILTAAHCTYRTLNLKVMLGSYKIDTRNDPRDERAIFNITRRNVFQHSEYNPNNYAYDISIIRLPEKVVFNDRIRPVCLPNRHYISKLFIDETALVSGWGISKDSATRASPYLKESDVRVIPNSDCRLAFRGVVNGNLICTSTHEYASPCKGDTGGPLMVKQDSVSGSYYMQVGIVSFGSESCETGLPIAYTRTSAFLDFINSVTGKTL